MGIPNGASHGDSPWVIPHGESSWAWYPDCVAVPVRLWLVRRFRRRYVARCTHERLALSYDRPLPIATPHRAQLGAEAHYRES